MIQNRKHNFTRTIIKVLCLSLMIGLITSIAIAWIAFTRIDVSESWGTDYSGLLYYSTHSDAKWEYCHYQVSSYEAVTRGVYNPFYPHVDGVLKEGPWWSGVREKPESEDVQSGNWVLEEGWGWPVICMYSSTKRITQFKLPFYWKILSGIPVGTRQLPYPRPALLPIQPIWRGLFLNTTLYAFVGGLVLIIWIHIRNTSRRKRGLCIYCRYTLHDLPVCPECGREANM